MKRDKELQALTAAFSTTALNSRRIMDIAPHAITEPSPSAGVCIMKKRLCCAAISLSLGYSTISSAHEAEVKTFSGDIHGFALLQPGYVPAAAEPAPPRQEQLDLGSEFVRLVQDSTDSLSDAQQPGDISVPNWMRRHVRSPADLPAIGFNAADANANSCEKTMYRPHPQLSAVAERRRAQYFNSMASAACDAGVPVSLFDALIIQESRYNPMARSVMGAAGLAQLMPGTARELGVWNSWDVSQNLRGGATYLRQQLDTFGNWALALGAYNAGPGNVRKHKGVPPFRETRDYVRTILSSVSRYQRTMPTDGNGQARTRRATLASF